MNLFYPNTIPPHSLSPASILPFPFSFAWVHRTLKYNSNNLLLGWNYSPVRAKLNQSGTESSVNGGSIIAANDKSSGSSVEFEESVEVIVVGSRKDALLDFCFASPFLSPALRFWNITGYDSGQILLQPRCPEKERTPRTAEDFIVQQSSCKAVIIVASAAYGSDHITVLDVLSNVNSGCRTAVAIILKPFSFEGQRRQNEIDDLVNKLQNKANFCIGILKSIEKELSTENPCDLIRNSNKSLNQRWEGPRGCSKYITNVRQLQFDDSITLLKIDFFIVNFSSNESTMAAVLDTNALLENDLVTLDEALRTSSNAVLMSMNAISILASEKNLKLLNTKDNSTREVQFPEFREILESHNEARIAYGAGHNVETSLLGAINECPFFGVRSKELDGVIFCMFASSCDMEYGDVNTIFHTVRLVTGCNREIIISIVREPHLEPNVISATVIAFGCTTPPRNGIFSNLGQHFPFLLNMFKKPYQQPVESRDSYAANDQQASFMANSPTHDDMYDANLFGGTTEDSDVLYGKTPPLSDNSDERNFPLSNYLSEREEDSLEGNPNSTLYEFDVKGFRTLSRELPVRGNMEPGHIVELSKYGSNLSEKTASVDTVCNYKLPVGVKHLEKMEDTLTLKTKERGEGRATADEKKQHNTSPGVPWNGLTETGVPTILYFSSEKASTSNRRKFNRNSEKQGGLSVRAASMLESERESQKKWSRVVKMNYRGGIYRGHVQGGLPEGKGRLLLGDGSIYDGIWRYGKRSGLGTFNFNNGDVFQGSWRDDLMHGKGWYYFHTGDRWFVNFWKGKANGESRFYSKLGDVFFGHFKDGWRHGYFLRINVDGTRCEELWDEGVLISEKTLDPDTEVA